MKILLTGGSGLIGSALYPLLCEKGYDVKCALRRRSDNDVIRDEDIFYYNGLGSNADWSMILNDIDVVVHLAAQVPMAGDNSYDKFFEINFKGTETLAIQAVRAKVKRFIFISSIGIYGTSDSEISLNENNRENPDNNYSLSKQMAEHALCAIGNQTGMEIIILRLPLVYGPHVKANFLKLLDYVYKGIPLPFAGVKNKRNFIALDNVLQAIHACIVNEKAGNEIFIISDYEYISTNDLIQKISFAMGKPPRLFRLPQSLAKLFLTIIGRKDLYNKLWGSLRVDSKKIRDKIGWVPTTSIDEGIKITVDWYLSEKNIKK